MGITHRERHGFRSPAMADWKQVVLCALIIALLPAPLFAQTLRSKTPPVLVPTMPDDRVVIDKGDSPADASKKKMCSIQPFPGLPATVSVASLQVPPKAQKEYQEACAALKNKKLPETEKHLSKATEIYPNYVAGWVMLGQILGTRQQAGKARDACSRASSADPNYLPAYLCLAEIAGREEKWNEVLNLTSRALELDPVNDAYAYFFSAIAYFKLNQLPEAETRALKAAVIDKDHYEPLIQFLLAQIYEAKHDSADAASHLQEYQKMTLDSQDSNTVKKESGKAHNLK
jgi:predicted Zn-dependent protease